MESILPFLQVSGVSKQNGDIFLLNEINFSIPPFRKLAIVGETGSGKSTLLKIIAGWVQPDAGKVLLEGRRVKGPYEKLLPGHKSIGYVSQQYELRNNYKVMDELDCVNELTASKAGIIYEICQVTHLLNRKTDQLSGGERQRIATARVLIGAPKLLLLDEPYSNLDSLHKQVMKEVIRNIADQLKITCILISHDPRDILSWAEEIIILKNGSIIQQGSPYSLYFKPVNAYTGGLLGNFNLVTPELLNGTESLKHLIQHGKSCFIRPQSIRLADQTENSIPASIEQVSFNGDYFEVKLLVSGVFLTMHTFSNTLTPGNWINISINAAEVWYL
jgi:ABC-type sugar transport system ATPase subunit